MREVNDLAGVIRRCRLKYLHNRGLRRQNPIPAISFERLIIPQLRDHRFKSYPRNFFRRAHNPAVVGSLAQEYHRQGRGQCPRAYGHWRVCMREGSRTGTRSGNSAGRKLPAEFRPRTLPSSKIHPSEFIISSRPPFARVKIVLVQKKPFTELGLSPELLKAVGKVGFEEATPIQSAAIPALLTGVDLVGQSQTGSGKTAAFAIPAIERIDPPSPPPRSSSSVRPASSPCKSQRKSQSSPPSRAASESSPSTADRATSASSGPPAGRPHRHRYRR